MNKFVIRTVKNGTVRIFGKLFAPSSNWMKYDGRLDNQRFAFGLYKLRPDLICLWGTEQEYHSNTAVGTRPYVVDGGLPWLWWNEIIGK